MSRNTFTARPEQVRLVMVSRVGIFMAVDDGRYHWLMVQPRTKYWTTQISGRLQFSAGWESEGNDIPDIVFYARVKKRRLFTMTKQACNALRIGGETTLDSIQMYDGAPRSLRKIIRRLNVV